MKAPAFIQRVLNDLQLFPWLSIAGFSLALFAQFLFEPAARVAAAVVFYIAALGFIAWAILRGEWKLASLPFESIEIQVKRPRMLPLIVSLCLLGTAFYFFGENRFTVLNLTLWSSGIILFIIAFWIPRHPRGIPLRVDWEWMALLMAVLVLAAFFRFYQIDGVPAEPFSDHAEKILDVHDISQGETPVFFERNTGREAIQMYWTLLVAKIFGTGIS